MKNPPIKLSITTLSPINIGCDEVYEPSNFVISNNLLHHFNEADLISIFSEEDKKSLLNAINSNEPVEAIQKFFRENAEKFASVSTHQVEVAPDIINQYNKTAGRPAQIGGNTALFQISRTAFNPFDNQAYIPGSSLKGSIRTAYLDIINNGNQLPSNLKNKSIKNRSELLQQDLLNYTSKDLHDDPFSKLKIADTVTQHSSVPTKIIYAISKKKRPPKPNELPTSALKVFIEAIYDSLPNIFKTSINLDGKITWNILSNACNKFYLPQLKRELEHENLSRFLDKDWKTLISSFLLKAQPLIEQNKGFILRVGHHSGAESITLNGIREIKIMLAKGKGSEDRAETTQKRFACITKACESGLMPFGWIWVQIDNLEQTTPIDNLFLARSKSIIDNQKTRIQENINKQKKQVERLNELIKQQEEKSKQQKIAEEEKAKYEADLAKRSLNQRRILNLKQEYINKTSNPKWTKENAYAKTHTELNQLAKDALENESWSAEEKIAVADLIEEFLPKLVNFDIKDARKKMSLAKLRGQV